MPEIYAVMGYPIGHSRSPEIHRRFASQLGVPIDYRRIEVKGGALAQAVAHFAEAGGSGCNVTVPLKEEAARLSAVLGPEARQAGAVNTLTITEDGSIRGDNTDGLGLIRHLRCNLGVDLNGVSVLMIGAGGAARGVVAGLLAAGVAGITIVNRTANRALALARRFESLGAVHAAQSGADNLLVADLVINASSAGLAGKPPTLPSGTAKGALCVDMAYGAAAEAFLSWGRRGGADFALDGWGMLVEQAAESFSIWQGRRPDTRELLNFTP